MSSFMPLALGIALNAAVIALKRRGMGRSYKSNARTVAVTQSAGLVKSYEVNVEVYAPTEYPQLTLFADKTALNVGEVLTLNGNLTVYLMVDDIMVDSYPVANALVTLYIDGVSPGITARTDSNGDYIMQWVPSAGDVGSRKLQTQAYA